MLIADRRHPEAAAEYADAAVQEIAAGVIRAACQIAIFGGVLWATCFVLQVLRT
jgi:hypothetical protein